MRRQNLSRSQNKRVYAKGQQTHRKNFTPPAGRGGYNV